MNTTRLILAGALPCLALSSASANLTIDLRVVGLTPGTGTVSADGKLVKLDGDLPATIELQFWAQMTNDAPTTNVFGIQSLVGSIKSAPGLEGPAVLGTMSIASFALPFNNQSSGGTVQELTVPPDGSLDLGSNITSGVTIPISYIKPRKDPLVGGTLVGPGYYASNLDTAGATGAPLANGFELLMGTATFTVNALGEADGETLLNWVIPTFTQVAARGQIAQWTDGDGVNNNGNLQASEMFVGAPIVIEAIPEPGTAALLAGGLALLAARRRRAGYAGGVRRPLTRGRSVARYRSAGRPPHRAGPRAWNSQLSGSVPAGDTAVVKGATEIRPSTSLAAAALGATASLYFCAGHFSGGLLILFSAPFSCRLGARGGEPADLGADHQRGAGLERLRHSAGDGVDHFLRRSGRAVADRSHVSGDSRRALQLRLEQLGRRVPGGRQPGSGLEFHAVLRRRKDPLSGGTKLTSTVFASNLDPAGATMNATISGHEFLLGTATFTAESYHDADGSFFLEWVVPPFTTAANRGQMAIWTDGDGVNNNGNLQFSEISAGSQ